ncbi:CCHC-type domain-containing protein [Meloidogyne graminicola]|uniref:CCHC-type domain-containing protein n=1 Tax=Meloidogyne graminicola TaxID=189291 RepID=A0A8S9ZSI3_9BILA|nr:CCHC-type domain-containing protein [Meloidogyne graminicola]
MSNCAYIFPSAVFKIPKLQPQNQVELQQQQQQLFELMNNNANKRKFTKKFYLCNNIGHPAFVCPLRTDSNSSCSSTRSLASTSLNKGTYRLAAHELAQLANRFSHISPIMQLIMSLSIFLKTTAENMKR